MQTAKEETMLYLYTHQFLEVADRPDMFRQAGIILTNQYGGAPQSYSDALTQLVSEETVDFTRGDGSAFFDLTLAGRRITRDLISQQIH